MTSLILGLIISNTYYVKQDLTFVSRGVKLAATIVKPQGEGPFPAIAITHGSGREQRKSTYTQVFAQTLAEAGIVVLIWDKRGIGESEGEYVEQPVMDVPRDDLLAALEVLRLKNFVDPKKVGVFGHSQGGWTVALAAAKSKNVAFVVSSCGGGSAIYEQIAFQRSEMYRRSGGTQREVEQMRAYFELMMNYHATGDGYEEAKAAIRKSKNEKWYAQLLESRWFGTILTPPEKLDHSNSSFFVRAQYHPAKAEQAITVPTLAIFGDVDFLVDTKGASKKWKENFVKSGNDDLTIKLIKGMGHGPGQRTGGSYSMRPAYKKVLLDWLEQFTSSD